MPMTEGRIRFLYCVVRLNHILKPHVGELAQRGADERCAAAQSLHAGDQCFLTCDTLQPLLDMARSHCQGFAPAEAREISWEMICTSVRIGWRLYRYIFDEQVIIA